MLYNNCQIATAALLDRSRSNKASKFPHREYEPHTADHYGHKVLVLVPRLWNVSNWHQEGGCGPFCANCMAYATLDVPKSVKKHYCEQYHEDFQRVVVLPGLCGNCVITFEFKLGTVVNADVVLAERSLRRALRSTQPIWTDPEQVAYSYHHAAAKGETHRDALNTHLNMLLDNFVPAEMYNTGVRRWDQIARELRIVEDEKAASEDEEPFNRTFNDKLQLWVDENTMCYHEEQGYEPVGQFTGTKFIPFPGFKKATGRDPPRL